MSRFDGRWPERWTRLPVRLRRGEHLRLGPLFLGITLFASTLATPVGVAAASRVRCARARHAHFVARGSARPLTQSSLRIAGDIEEIDDDGKEQQEDADILA